MKENKYDDPGFFGRYSEMDRSVKGLEGAGEWSTLKKLLPDFNGKTVLDLGCGFGWHCIYAAENGASRVVGVDISSNMIERAKKHSEGLPIEYKAMAIEDYNYPEDEFDIVISSLAFHYIVDFDDIVKRVHSTLKAGGIFIFSVEHPVFTAYGSQQWFSDDENNILHWPLDRYFESGQRDAIFLGHNVKKYHRTISEYLTSLLDNGMSISSVNEPVPDDEMLTLHPEYEIELRRPMFLIISAVKMT